MTSSARDRAIEVLTEELEQHAGSGADAAEWAVDALLANPEVLRALTDQTTPDTSERAQRLRADVHQERADQFAVDLMAFADNMHTMTGQYPDNAAARNAFQLVEQRVRDLLAADRARENGGVLPSDAVRLVPAADEMAEHFIDANERMGDALVQIGMAVGLPRPTAQVQWGAPEILAKIAEVVPAAATTPTDDLAAIASRIDEAARVATVRWQQDDLRCAAADLRAVLARRAAETGP